MSFCKDTLACHQNKKKDICIYINKKKQKHDNKHFWGHNDRS
jgi:hypothetical protein